MYQIIPNTIVVWIDDRLIIIIILMEIIDDN